MNNPEVLGLTELPKATGLLNERGERIYVTDEMIDKLILSVSGGEKRREAEQKTKRLSLEQFYILRARCKRDLFFLAYGVLGYNRLSVDLHGHLCTQVAQTQNERFREWLLPRGYFKSTLLTIAHDIQAALPYGEQERLHDKDAGIELAYPYSLGTNIKILIGHETHEGSARFLYGITNHFTANVSLMALFPECIPEKKLHRINKWELELPRQLMGAPEPTFDTLGVGAKAQGRHYNLIDLDDIYGDKARDSEAESETTKQWFDNIQSFFSLFKKDHLKIKGTRYSFDDIYAHAHERYGNKLVKYIRKVEEFNPLTGRLEITFPEEFDTDSLEILKKNTAVYDAQYLNDPSDNKSGFDPAWKKKFYWLTLNTFCYFAGNKDNPEKVIVDIRDLDIYIHLDPGLGKSGGCVVCGLDHRGNIFVLSSIRIEMKPNKFTDFVFGVVIRWRPKMVTVETDGFQAVFEPYWQAEMTARNVRFLIHGVHTKKQEKGIRISGLTQYFADGRIWYTDAQVDLDTEVDRFGKSKNIHILDALAQGPEVWKPALHPAMRRARENGQEALEVLENRDPETGYSLIEYG